MKKRDVISLILSTSMLLTLVFHSTAWSNDWGLKKSFYKARVDGYNFAFRFLEGNGIRLEEFKWNTKWVVISREAEVVLWEGPIQTEDEYELHSKTWLFRIDDWDAWVRVIDHWGDWFGYKVQVAFGSPLPAPSAWHARTVVFESGRPNESGP